MQRQVKLRANNIGKDWTGSWLWTSPAHQTVLGQWGSITLSDCGQSQLLEAAQVPAPPRCQRSIPGSDGKRRRRGLPQVKNYLEGVDLMQLRVALEVRKSTDTMAFDIGMYVAFCRRITF